MNPRKVPNIQIKGLFGELLNSDIIGEFIVLKTYPSLTEASIRV